MGDGGDAHCIFFSMHSCAALARSLVALRSERRTGVLTVEMAGARTFVYLRAGIPVFAEEGTNGETLGRMLVRRGVLTAEQHATIIAKMTDALVLNEQLRFGELAVELGYLSAQQVDKALADQVRWKIVGCLQRAQVTWTFEDSEARLEDVGNFPMRIEALVLDAMRWLDDEQKSELGLERVRDTLLVPAEPTAEIATRFELSAPERTFVEALDGRRTVRELLATRDATEIDALALVTALVVVRAVTDAAAVKKPAPARPVTPAQAMPPPLARPATPMNPLPPPSVPLARPATPINAAPPPSTPLARPLTGGAFTPAAPPALQRPATGGAIQPARRDGRSRASQILAALEQKRVKADVSKAPENDHEAKLLAERAFQAGLAHAKAARWAAAAPEMQRAAQLLPASDEYKLYAKWAQLRARSEEMPHKIERAEVARLALAAIKTDPSFAFGYYLAGNMAMLDEEIVQAHRLLAKAVKLDPANLDAQRLLRVVERRVKGGSDPGEGGGGILGKKLW